MNVATINTGEIDALYAETKERLRALTIERANRIAANPDIAHAPDERDQKLAWAIFELKREFTLIEEIYLSARGELVLLGCVVGEHKYCKRRISREGATLVCHCDCHKLQGGKK